jgi:hypothetical protein
MKKMLGFIGLAFLHLMVACSSMAPTSQWQPTTVTEFKSVTGKWEGSLIRDHYFTQNFDQATIVIDDSGACEYAVVRTRATAQGGSVSHSVVGVLKENGKLVLTDGKLSATGSKGGQMTLQLYVDPGSGERILKANGKDSEGITYSANLKRTKDSASAK